MNGYVYILINSSLPGLIKVGMTNRSPEERALELSNNTNMPTPFVVAYYESVKNMNVVEKLVHQELEELGFRIRDNREFFSAPLKIAIGVLMNVASRSIDDEIALDVSSDDQEDDLGFYYLKKGTEEFSGTENTLQNFSEALKSFERAINFGSLLAYEPLGTLYQEGFGVKQSSQQALKIWQQGAEKGHIECYGLMWEVYSGSSDPNIRNHHNAELCFGWLIERSLEYYPTALSRFALDYLQNAYNRLNTTKKVRVFQLDGEHTAQVIDYIKEKARETFSEARKNKENDVPREDFINGNKSIYDVIIFDMLFLKEKIIGRHEIWSDILTGFDRSDIEYVFIDDEIIEYLSTCISNS